MMKRQRGTALVEVLVVAAITSLLTGALLPTMFQVVTGTDRGNDRLTALSELQAATRWVYQEGRMAKATDLVDGGPPVATVTLTWTEWNGGTPTDRTARYFLSGDVLRRDYGGQVTTVARHITQVQFWLVGRMLHFKVVAAADSNSEPVEVISRVWLRPG